MIVRKLKSTYLKGGITVQQVEDVIREALINRALEDINDPKNIELLKILSRKDWRTVLFTDKESYLNRNDETTDADKNPLFKDVFVETKRVFVHYFYATHWRMKQVGDWNLYQFGPVNYLNTIYYRFTIGENEGIVYWDMKDCVGNNPISRFKHYPNIIKDTLIKHKYDRIICQIKSGIKGMKVTGKKSELLGTLLLKCDEVGLNVLTDREGSIWIENKYRLIPDYETVSWTATDLNQSEIIIQSDDDIKLLQESLNH